MTALCLLKRARSAYLGQEAFAKFQNAGPQSSGDVTCCRRIEPIGPQKEARLEVIERVVHVVKPPILSTGIGVMVKRGTNAPRHIKAARDANEASRVEAVSITKDSRLDCPWRDTCGKAVRLDRMGHRSNPFARPALALQNLRGAFCRPDCGKTAVRVVLFDMDAVVEEGCSEQYRRAAAFCQLNFPCEPPDPCEVGQIVGPITRVNKPVAKSRCGFGKGGKLCQISGHDSPFPVSAAVAMVDAFDATRMAMQQMVKSIAQNARVAGTRSLNPIIKPTPKLENTVPV